MEHQRSSLTGKRSLSSFRAVKAFFFISRSRRKNVSLFVILSNFDDDDDEKKSVASEKQEEEVFLDRERKKRGRRRSHARARRDGILSRARRTFASDERDVVDFLSVIFVVVNFGDDDDDENNNNSNKNIEEAFCARAAASESVREPNIFVAPCRGEFATG